MKNNRPARYTRLAGIVLLVCALLLSSSPGAFAQERRPRGDARPTQGQPESGAQPAPAAPAAAQPGQPPKNDRPEKEAPSIDHLVTTYGDVTSNGKPLQYKATAGTMVLRTEAGKAKADVFFVAYEKQESQEKSEPKDGADGKGGRDGKSDAKAATTSAIEHMERKDSDAAWQSRHHRPVTFVFNGGPGAAAVWLHLGAAGPRRVKLTEDGQALPPPGQLEDNPDCWLDATDLVFIDPVGTGFSRPAAGEQQQEFSGVQEDAQWVAEFIRLYTTRNNRWLSPKFLIGESYGTTRAAALSEYLINAQGIAVNGIVFISTVLNFQNLSPGSGNDLPYALYLPSYTATAAWHKKLADDLRSDLPKTLKDVEKYALGDYLAVLAKGDALTAPERQSAVQKVARYTGLPADVVDKANLRIDPGLFRARLLEDQHKVIGRFDARVAGYNPDPLEREAEFDPSFDAFFAAYTGAFNEYVRRTLKFETDLHYEVLTGKVRPWNMGRSGEGYLNVADNLQRAMRKDESLKVLFASGTSDLATPYLATDYTVNHLQLSPALRKNISQTYYASGHMIYHPRGPAHKLHEDIRAFIESAESKAGKTE